MLLYFPLYVLDCARSTGSEQSDAAIPPGRPWQDLDRRRTGVSGPLRHSSATTLKLLDEMSQLEPGSPIWRGLMDISHDTFVE